MNQNQQTLYTAVSYSYLCYIQAYFNLQNNSLFFSTSYLDEETAKCQETLKAHFLDLPELLSQPAEKKEARINELLAMRETIENKYRVLIAYQKELSLLLSIKQNDPTFIDQYFESVGLNDLSAREVDFYQLANDCIRYIFEQTTGEEKQKRAAMLLPYLPIRITRTNYVHYVSKSIRHIAISNQLESAKHLVSILNQLFDGRKAPGYGKHFADLALSLENLSQITHTAELFEEADLLNETLENLMDMLTQMFRMIATYSNLLILPDLDFNELTNQNAAFFDLYYSLKNIALNTEDRSMLLVELPKRLEEIITDVQKAYVDTCKKEKAPSPVLTLMQTYLAMHISQIFGFSTAKHSAYSKEVLAILDDFTKELQATLNDMPTVERKYRMQYLMGQIPFVMSKENFDAYAHQAFARTTNPRSMMMIAAQLSAILEENHFYPTPAETPVIETNYEEDDEAAAFIRAHADLFEEKEDDDFHFFETLSGDLSTDEE